MTKAPDICITKAGEVCMAEIRRLENNVIFNLKSSFKWNLQFSA